MTALLLSSWPLLRYPLAADPVEVCMVHALFYLCARGLNGTVGLSVVQLVSPVNCLRLKYRVSTTTGWTVNIF